MSGESEPMRTVIIILVLFGWCQGKEVAVVFGGYPDPHKTGSPISQTEFFTERQDSCVYSEEFNNISTIFHYSWGPSNSVSLMGVFVPDRGIFACPGDCVHLGSSRLPDTAWHTLPCRNDDQLGMAVDCYRTDGLATWQTDRGFLQLSKESNLFSANTLVYTASDDFMQRRSDITMNSE